VENHFGIALGGSGNTLRNNSMAHNTFNFGAFAINDIDISNTVDNKPIYYYVNASDVIVPNDAGFVAFINCERVNCQNLSLTHNGYGIIMANTTNVKITQNNLSENNVGARLVDCSNIDIVFNNISGNYESGLRLDTSYDIHGFPSERATSNISIVGNNIASNGGTGIYAYGQSWVFLNISIVSNRITKNKVMGIWSNLCRNTTINGNDIEGNSHKGLYIAMCSNSTVFENNVSSNGVGIYIDRGKVYHNNFTDNNIQVNPTNKTSVTWDDGYPNGGNYWSDYNGTDSYSGVFQNDTGFD
jgi:parallel beta-helix repeat protein